MMTAGSDCDLRTLKKGYEDGSWRSFARLIERDASPALGDKIQSGRGGGGRSGVVSTKPLRVSIS